MYAENCVNRIIKNLLKVYVISGSMLKLTMYIHSGINVGLTFNLFFQTF